MAVTAVFLPHPVTLEGRTVRRAEPGATPRALLAGLGDVVAAADGRAVGPEELDAPLRDGAVLVARAAARGGDDSNPLRVVLQVALLVAAFYTAGATSAAGWSLFAQAAASAAIVVGGTLVINAIAPPVLPSPGSGGASRPEPVYSLTGGANRARPYEPLLLVLGSHRVFPDLGAAEYTTFSSAVPAGAATVGGSGARVGAEFAVPGLDAARRLRDAAITDVPAELARYDADPGLLVKLADIDVHAGGRPRAVVYEARRAGAWTDVTAEVPDWLRGQPSSAGGSTDQYLHQILHFGIGGDLDVEDLRIADTPLADFDDVATEWSDGGALSLVAGNVDTEAGAALEDADWVARRTAAGATRAELDFTARLFELGPDGSSATRSVVLDVEATPPDGGAAQTTEVTLRHGDPSPYRLTVSRDLSAAPGVWTVRVRRRTAPTTDAQREAAGRNEAPVRYDDVAWTALRSFQPDPADYAGQRRLAVAIRASGQLSGRLDRVSATAHRRIPTWDGAAWTAPVRSSNPAWIFRWYALGHRVGGRLLAGVGLAAARLDDAAIKAWGAWCDLHGLGCNAVLDRDMTHADVLALVAQCGRASPTWTTGRLGVVYDAENVPATASFTPQNIAAGSFEAQWASGAVADEIVCRYTDPDLDWQRNTVRRAVPGAARAGRTAVLDLPGVTSRDQAAQACNLQAARQLYHRRRLRWRTGKEGRAVDRGHVVHVSHALVDGGTTGRLLGGGVRNVRLDRDLAVAAGDMMLFRLPNGDLHRTAVTRPGGLDDDQVRLGDVLPEAPGSGTSSALDILWRHYAADEPPLRAKVVAVEPQADGSVSIEAIDEVPEYYAAATSDLTVDLPALHRAPPAVVGIRVAERLVDAAASGRVVEIIATLEVGGDWRGGAVTASLDGGPARRVAQLAADELEARWVEPPGGTLAIRAVPGSAAAPAGRAFEVVYEIKGPLFAAPAASVVVMYQVVRGEVSAIVPAVPALPVHVDRDAGTATNAGAWMLGDAPAYDLLTHRLWSITAPLARLVEPADWTRKLESPVGVLASNFIYTVVNEGDDPPARIPDRNADGSEAS